MSWEPPEEEGREKVGEREGRGGEREGGREGGREGRGMLEWTEFKSNVQYRHGLHVHCTTERLT